MTRSSGAGATTGPVTCASSSTAILAVGVLAVLAFTDVGDALLPDWSWWAQALVYPAIVLALLTARSATDLLLARLRARAPLGALDAVGARAGSATSRRRSRSRRVLATILLFGLVALARWTDAWPLVAAPLAARSSSSSRSSPRSCSSRSSTSSSRSTTRSWSPTCAALSERVGVPVRDVLVADASRRTTKSNAYVSGFGATRRVVVYDTLLEQMKPAELRAVLAHELAHRKHGDVV